MTEYTTTGSLNRRRFLQAAGVAAGTAMLAGCSGVTDQEFVADTVVLPEDAQRELGFAPVVERTERRTIEQTVAGQDVSATIESSVGVYADTDIEFDFAPGTETATGTETGTGSLADLDAETLGGGALTVGALSTPAARVGGQSVNPLARASLSDLLTNEQAEEFLSSSGAGDGERIEWERDPELVSTAEGTLLDQDVTVETHAGIVSGETPNATYLHMARVETDSSVVISVGIQSFDVEDTGREYVGPDGYLTEAELEDVRSTVVEVTGRFVVQ